VSLQRGLAERNVNLPEDQRLRVRIGINLGEVIVEGDDRFGEGVNIAARLEQLADPGGICVSAKVAEVEKKLAFGSEPMGAQHCQKHRRAYPNLRVRLDGSRSSTWRPHRSKHTPLGSWLGGSRDSNAVRGRRLAYPSTSAPGTVAATVPASTVGQRSLVVLPFANLSDSTEQGYLADGITEDLTSELANVPGLFVVSRNAAFSYKGKVVPPAQINKELGVRYILEGSTRRVADEMRIDAQLVDAQTGGYIWAQRFDGPWAGVFALQDKVVENVAGALKLRLTSEGKAQIAGGTSNPAAYEAFLRGLELELRCLRPRISPKPSLSTSKLSPSTPISGAPLPSLPGSIGMQPFPWRMRWVSRETRWTRSTNISKKRPSIPHQPTTRFSPSNWSGGTNPMRPSPRSKRPSRSMPATPGAMRL
jgi:TolB-like protein